MIGFLLGIVKNMMFIGYSIVEALVFMWAFNYFAPFVSESIICLPVIHLIYWQCLSLFILIHFLGGFIKKLNPLSVNINNKQEVENK